MNPFAGKHCKRAIYTQIMFQAAKNKCKAGKRCAVQKVISKVEKERLRQGVFQGGLPAMYFAPLEAA